MGRYAEETEKFLKKLKKGTALGVALQEPTAEDTEEEKEDEPSEQEESEQLLFGPPATATDVIAPLSMIAISVQPGEALAIKLDSNPAMKVLSAVLKDSAIPKAIHDSKAAMRLLMSSGSELTGVSE